MSYTMNPVPRVPGWVLVSPRRKRAPRHQIKDYADGRPTRGSSSRQHHRDHGDTSWIWMLATALPVRSILPPPVPGANWTCSPRSPASTPWDLTANLNFVFPKPGVAELCRRRPNRRDGRLSRGRPVRPGRRMPRLLECYLPYRARPARRVRRRRLHRPVIDVRVSQHGASLTA